MKYLFVFFLAIGQFGFAQTNELEVLLEELAFQEDTIRTVYDWITETIAYDSRKLNQIKNQTNRRKLKTNSLTEKARKRELLEQVLITKKGVCEDYSLLFDTIMSSLGYESYIITGYTKKPDGKINQDVGHAWNAVKSNDQWRLYDLTWGAGAVREDGKFIRKTTDHWFDVEPSEMIKRHMPYDPLWQLLENPVNYDEFRKGHYQHDLRRDKAATIKVDQYLSLNEKQQLAEKLDRSSVLSGNTKLLNNWRERTKNKIAYFDGVGHAMTLQTVGQQSKEAVNTLNQYGQAKKKRFIDPLWTVDYSRDKLLEIQDVMNEAVSLFSDARTKKLMSKQDRKKTISQAKNILSFVKKELKFLDDTF